VNSSLFNREDVVGIGVQSGRGQKGVELAQVLAVEENHGRPMLGNLSGLAPAGGCKEQSEEK
jgi:hypothetical protein